ncbi:MAG: hypothetical protein ABIO79_08620 [Ferruginibacter sp.]
MPTPEKYKAPFYPGAFYHIVCKSIDGVPLFTAEKDYLVFKERFKQFTADFFEVWSYNLIPNHTHHIVKVIPTEVIIQVISSLPVQQQTKAMALFIADSKNDIVFDEMIERQMNSFLVSYANYCNNKRNRKGGIFQKPFKRIRIEDDAHLQQAIIYTNANAQKHNLVTDFKKYPHSSYTGTVTGNNIFIMIKNVLDFFGGLDNFINIHKNQVDYYYQHDWPSSKLE